jgi:hypothetical protein
MFRRHWNDPGFWKWWWQHRLSAGARNGAGVGLVVLLLAGGWLAADHLTSAGAGTGTEAYVLQTTVERLVTVREEGKLVRRRVPVVKRVLVRPPSSLQAETRYQTELVTVAGTTRVVKQPVVRYVPRVEDRLVTVNGRTTTVSETRLVPTTTVRTRTQTAVVTAERTVTATLTQTEAQTVTDTRVRTITNTRTETTPPVTTTVTATQTLPASTVTVVVTVTVPRK